MKVRDKMKSKLRDSMSMKRASPLQNSNYMKSHTNVNGDTSPSFMNVFKKMKPKKNNTFKSDDYPSDNSSDLDFATNHREYNKMQKVLNYCLIIFRSTR
jgi:hypothetical protein